MSNVTVAAVQMSPSTDREENVMTALRLMEKAVEKGAQIIGLPEDFSYAGESEGKLTFATEPHKDHALKALKHFAKNYNVSVVGGSMPFATKHKKKVTNSCMVIDQTGEIKARYDKIHLFDVTLDKDYTHKESEIIKGGDKVVTVDLLGKTVGLSICYDLRFPELYRALALSGARIIFVPAAFTLYTGKDHWEVLLRSRAIENQCYVVAPAQCGEYKPGIMTYGRSMIIDPWGEVMVKCQDKEDVIVAELDMDFLEDVRKRLPSLRHLQKELFFTPKT